MLKSCFSRRNGGNVLFLILIAVALFAALTYVITKSSSGGGGNLQRERGTIDASDVMSFGATMEKSVARMLSSDMSESGLSFENANWKYYDGDPVETAGMFPACSSATCKVFDPSGGGMAAQTFAQQSVSTPVDDDVQSGHGIVYALKVTGVGSAAQDLVLMIAVISQNTCMAINDALRIPNPGSTPPLDSWAGAVPYNGTFSSAGDATGEIGDIATGIVGKTAGCITRQGGAYGTSDNYFYQVLLPR